MVPDLDCRFCRENSISFVRQWRQPKDRQQSGTYFNVRAILASEDIVTYNYRLNTFIIYRELLKDAFILVQDPDGQLDSSLTSVQLYLV